MGRIYDSVMLPPALCYAGFPQTTVQESSTLIRFQIHHLAWKLLCRELVSTPSSPSATAPQTPASVPISGGCNSGLQQPPPHDRLCVLREFATQIVRLALPGTGSIGSVSSQMEEIFRRISALLGEGSGEEALTAYEVITSGLINALLLCLSPTRILSWASAITLKPQEAQDPSVHFRFLQARRLAFCRAFMPSLGGAGISSLVRRLIEALDQTQRLPLNLFERMESVRHIPSRKIKTKPVQSDAAAAATPDSQSKKSAGGSQMQLPPGTTALPSCAGQEMSTLTRTSVPPPVSCPPSTAGGVVFTFQSADPTDDSAAPMNCLPLGLLCPRSEMWEMTHRSLNGGGVRALLDRQVNLVLGEFVPSSAYSMCTGRLGMLQLQQGCPLLMERDEVAIECEAPDASGRLRLARMANHTIFVTTLTSVGRLRSRVKELTAKYWYQLPRTEMVFFRMFRDKPGTSILLVPSPENDSTQQQKPTTSSPDESTLMTGVIDWLGTDAGSVSIKDWMNPLNLNLIQALIIPSNAPFLGNVADAFAPQLGRSNSKTSQDNAVGLLVGLKGETWQEDDEVRKKAKVSEADLGPGLVFDLGVQLIPSAYSLAQLRGKLHELPGPVAPRNWCLQASNNGQNWVTLRVHVNDTILDPEVGTGYTWPLDPSSATPWPPQKAQPGGEESALSSQPDLKDKTAQEHEAVPLAREGASFTATPPGWRVYRIMGTGPNSLGSCDLPIGSLELYGRIVGVHDKLLSPSDINGHRRHSSAHHKDEDSGDATRPSQSTKSANSSREDTINGIGTNQTIDLTQSNSIRQLLPSWWRRLISFGAGVNASHLASLALSIDRFGLTSCTGNSRGNESDDDDDDGDEEEDAFSFHRLTAARDSLRLPLSELLDLIVRDARLPRRFRDSIGTSHKSASVDLLQPLSPSLGGRERAATVDLPDLRSNMRRRRRRLVDVQPSQYASASDSLRYDSPATIKTNHLVRGADSMCRLSHASEFISCCDSDDAFLETDGGALEFAEAVDALVQMNTDSPCTVTTVDMGDNHANQDKKTRTTTTPVANTSQEKGVAQEPQLVSGADGEEEEAVTLEDVFTNLSDEDKTVDDSDVLLAANSDIQADGDNDTDNDESAEQVFATSTTASAGAAGTTGEETADVSRARAHATGDGPSSETGHSSSRWASPGVEGDTIIPETMQSQEDDDSPVDDGVAPTCRSGPRITETVEEHSERRTTSNVVGSKDDCINEHNNLAPGLIPAFDPTPRNRNASASSEFILKRPPGSSSLPDAYAVKLTEPDKTQIVITLKAYLRDGSLVASIRAKDNNRPIFNYFFQLAQKAVYSSVLTNSPLLDSIIEEGEEGATERLTLKVNYRFRTPEDDLEEEKEEEDDAKGRTSTDLLADTPRMLTHRDIRLATFQDECIRLACQQKLPGVLNCASSANLAGSESSASFATTASKVEQLLELIRVIHQITGTQNLPLSDFGNDLDAAPQPVTATFCTSDDEMETEQELHMYDLFATSGLNNDLAPEHFISQALSRKLIRQLMDPLAVVSSTLPDWCFNLPRRLPVLFPYEVRLNLLNSSAFGAARYTQFLRLLSIFPLDK
ncbi:unnamed protein product [Schistocephalus solidus]|uniref:E3 ubiquitin-protein ligase n=1 Tax=Schistocephalus solidus TaxID=70667 RepID=A0A183SMW9_SCHSO|nr:unnamed protein product [Schistocephalus solidus]